MKNQDMPAMPHVMKGIPDYAKEAGFKEGPDSETHWYGLTKLEYAAIAAMQGICVNAGRNGHQLNAPSQIANTAVDVAKALLAELEKE